MKRAKRILGAAAIAIMAGVSLAPSAGMGTASASSAGHSIVPIEWGFGISVAGYKEGGDNAAAHLLPASVSIGDWSDISEGSGSPARKRPGRAK